MDPPDAELDEREDLEGPEPGGLDGEEVAGDDPVRLSTEELGPGRTGPPRGRTESLGPEQAPDRRCTHSAAELAELACDPHAAPAGVLPGEAEEEPTDLEMDRGPSRATPLAVGDDPDPSPERSRSRLVSGVDRQSPPGRGAAR